MVELPVVLLALVTATLIIATRNAVKSSHDRWAWRVSAALLWAGLLSFIVHVALGSTLDENGVLHEQFTFVLVGWVLFLAGTLGAVVTGLRSRRRTRHA
ncbi:DUF3955 domain-containing protein [Streptomyces sioyaensis]|uniref:DUF3955 domain-containing protein n=1 Tax=Streptomyces sioyaensis TaxID=67364 RepID=UPI0037AB6720